jgi:hypothetical protein
MINGHRSEEWKQHSILDVGRREIESRIAGHPGSRQTPVLKSRYGAQVRRELIVVIVSVELPGQLQLLEMVQASDALAFGLGPRQRRQKHRSQDRDDRDDDQQLDQGKSPRERASA